MGCRAASLPYTPPPEVRRGRRPLRTSPTAKLRDMIKLLHLADLHICMENYGRLDPASGMHTRLIDYLDRLDEAIEYGLDEGADAVLIAGDVYKNRTPNP